MRFIKELKADVAISAKENDGIEILLQKITDSLRTLSGEEEVQIPADRMDIVNKIYTSGKVFARCDTDQEVVIQFIAPKKVISYLKSSYSDVCRFKDPSDRQ